MKTILRMVMAALLLGIGGQSHAQSDSVCALRPFVWQIDNHTSMYSDDFAPIEFGAELGYRPLGWLTVALRYEQAFALSEVGGERMFEKNYTLGLSLRADLLRFDDWTFAAKATGGSSLASGDWEYTYYDAGIGLYEQIKRVELGVAVGVRYYDTRGDFTGNHLRAYAALSVRSTL